MRRDEIQEKGEDSMRPRAAEWIAYRDWSAIYLFGWMIKYKLRRGFPEWEVREPVSNTRYKSREPRHLPETEQVVREAALYRGVKTVELSIKRAMRLICDEVITQRHFSSAKVADDGVHFDNVSIDNTDGDPVLVNIVVLRPSAFIRDETALSQPPTALAA